MSTALKAVKEILGGEAFPKCESVSLRLQKFVCLSDKGETVKAVCGMGAINHYPKLIVEGERIIAQLKSRLIVNQAGGILENAGLCLHHHFGYPYIPGSAVKGLARHAAWCEWKAEEEEAKKLEVAKQIAQVFGFPTGDKDGLDAYLAPHVKEQSGSVCFMAAEPIGKASLVADIVTCHHTDYYSGKRSDAKDVENPNPQFFPAVEKGAKFQFQVMPLKPDAEGLLEKAKEWLIDSITIHGIGAKTAAGYGWFEDITKKYLEEEARQQEIADKQRREKELLEEVKTLEQVVGEMLTPEQVTTYRSLKEKANGISNQQIVDSLNKLAKKLPQESEEDKIRNRWNALKNRDAILKEDLVKNFHKKDAMKQEVVARLFRAEFNDVYKKIMGGIKGFSGDAQKAIKDAVKGGGK